MIIHTVFIPFYILLSGFFYNLNPSLFILLIIINHHVHHRADPLHVELLTQSILTFLHFHPHHHLLHRTVLDPTHFAYPWIEVAQRSLLTAFPPPHLLGGKLLLFPIISIDLPCLPPPRLFSTLRLNPYY